MQIKDFEIDPSLKELTKHQTVSLPIACYQTTIEDHIQGYIPLHWHDEFQFVRIMKGEAIFRVNEEKIIVKEGNGIFINSGCLHMAEKGNQTGCDYICLNVSPLFLLPQELYTMYVYPYVQATNFPFLYLDANQAWGQNILQSLQKINEYVQNKSDFYELEVTLQLTFIWQNLIVNGFQLEYNETEMIRNQRMKQMLNWIHAHFSEKITLDEIARVGQLSRSECCRYFKKMLKTTPLNYVIDYRIQKSLILLKQAEVSVTEVAYQVGFNSTSYYIDKFRQKMKLTPLAYKKQRMEE